MLSPVLGTVSGAETDKGLRGGKGPQSPGHGAFISFGHVSVNDTAGPDASSSVLWEEAQC